MRKSIKRQIMALSVSLVAGMMLIFLIINGGFLEQYYVANKQTEFEKVYERLEKGVEDGTISMEDPDEELNKFVEKNNIAVMVLDADYNPVYMSARNLETLRNQLQGYLFEKNTVETLQKTENYTISRTIDARNGSEYLEMWGGFENGSIFIARSPLESIRTAVALFDRFVGMVGIFLIVVGSGVAWYVSKRLTEPIMELAKLSQKMADLDFEAKYRSDRDDEIGVLGRSFNQMSEKLEQTISGLKQANYELQKDIERREELENMRTEFLGNVSHELKTPIALIQGYAEGLKEGISDDPESQEFYCEVIMDEAGKMNRMVKNLLDLNQLEYGKEDVHFERFDITALIAGVLQSSEIMIAQKEAKVLFQENTPVFVWADQFKAEQVVRNYFTNALNHLDGEKVIEVKIQKEENTARISVFNTGAPIPEEDVAHIWEKFYKVDKARTREYGGNGIGLSIVKAIMESFQKPYGVKNYDNGVEFWFELDVK